MKEVMKFKIKKLRKLNRKCSICHRLLRKLTAEMWWENEGNETFHHNFHIGCLYWFVGSLKEKNEHHKKIMKSLEEKYTKEIVLDKLK